MKSITKQQLDMIIGIGPLLCEGCHLLWWPWQVHDFSGCCKRTTWTSEALEWAKELQRSATVQRSPTSSTPVF